MDIRSMNKLHRCGNFISCILDNAVCGLHICIETTFVTACYCILAYGCKEHEFVWNTAAHHTGIGLDRDYLGNTCTSEYVFISLVALIVILLKIFLRCVEWISVLHCELTYSDKTASRASFITELCLYLINHKRVLRVALAVFTHKMHSGFLVCHTEYHRHSVAVCET